MQLVSLKQELEQKYVGMVVGAAVGDALGMPAEGLSREEIKDKFGLIQHYLRPQKDSKLNYLQPGQYTDDTQLLLATIKGMTEYDTYDLEYFVAEILKVEELRGAGMATSKALKQLKKGEFKLSTGREDLGAGAMTRVAPLALLSQHRSHVSYSLLVEEVTALTHKGDVALASAFLYGNILATLVTGYGANLESQEGIRDFLHSVSICQSWDSKNILKLKHSVSSIGRCLEKSEERYAACFKLSGSVLDVLPAALYSFLKSPTNFEESILRAVNLGGDTDTIAFVTGQLSGAYNGAEIIPIPFLRGLEHYQEIIGLGKKLYQEIHP